MSPTADSAITIPRARATWRPFLIAGVIGPLLLMAVNIIDGATRPGYDPWRHWVSHLALGDRGWLGMANLTLCGVLLLVFAVGLRQALGLSRRARWAAWLVLIAGLGFVTVAIFPIDPGLGYPPGLQADTTIAGNVHDLAGVVVFGSLIGAAVLLGRCISDAAPWGYLIAAVIATSFLACSVLVALDYAGTLPSAPSGFLERVALFTGLGWLAIVAVRLLRGTR